MKDGNDCKIFLGGRELTGEGTFEIPEIGDEWKQFSAGIKGEPIEFTASFAKEQIVPEISLDDIVSRSDRYIVSKDRVEFWLDGAVFLTIDKNGLQEEFDAIVRYLDAEHSGKAWEMSEDNNTENKTEQKLFKRLWFFVVAELDVDGNRVKFTVYDIEGLEDGDEKKPLFHKEGSPSHPDPVRTIEEADIYLHGEVKWDGCSNWHFDQQDRVMLHGCSREDVQRYGDIMGACWDWASELLPNWIG